MILRTPTPTSRCWTQRRYMSYKETRGWAHSLCWDVSAIRSACPSMRSRFAGNGITEQSRAFRFCFVVNWHEIQIQWNNNFIFTPLHAAGLALKSCQLQVELLCGFALVHGESGPLDVCALVFLSLVATALYFFRRSPRCAAGQIQWIGRYNMRLSHANSCSWSRSCSESASSPGIMQWLRCLSWSRMRMRSQHWRTGCVQNYVFGGRCSHSVPFKLFT